ncbi:uncharacterized protein LY79DRAFT_676843 [Colletotrichum navitas]|uniref:Uncharacterized protein n=1 Tax=Colletotrichum navitas TaxID=681940 RepID=A0AAD8Q6G2_9PEZI|nr:uncharacterized protein LY79DRAFT_676843 [Colletotrichum navitas]KAK1596805.1 hypothetical protein LY79DRAFT_676843 [Colletotrichum navitas]
MSSTRARADASLEAADAVLCCAWLEEKSEVSSRVEFGTSFICLPGQRGDLDLIRQRPGYNIQERQLYLYPSRSWVTSGETEQNGNLYATTKSLRLIKVGCGRRNGAVEGGKAGDRYMTVHRVWRDEQLAHALCASAGKNSLNSSVLRYGAVIKAQNGSTSSLSAWAGGGRSSGEDVQGHFFLAGLELAGCKTGSRNRRQAMAELSSMQGLARLGQRRAPAAWSGMAVASGLLCHPKLLRGKDPTASVRAKARSRQER